MQARANEICSADFIADALWSRRRFRTFNVIDNCNREVLKTRSTRGAGNAHRARCVPRQACGIRGSKSPVAPRGAAGLAVCAGAEDALSGVLQAAREDLERDQNLRSFNTTTSPLDPTGSRHLLGSWASRADRLISARSGLSEVARCYVCADPWKCGALLSSISGQCVALPSVPTS